MKLITHKLNPNVLIIPKTHLFTNHRFKSRKFVALCFAFKTQFINLNVSSNENVSEGGKMYSHFFYGNKNFNFGSLS